MSTGWRPIHRSLCDESLAVMAGQRANGVRPTPVHLALVTDDVPQRYRTACDAERGFRAWGEWITGSGSQVTCPECLETVHA